MRKYVLFFLAIFANQLTNAQVASKNNRDTLNFGFEKVSAGKTLPNNWHLMSRNPKQYYISIDSQSVHSGSRSVLISSVDTALSPIFAGVGYTLPARYVGKKITVSAWMRSEDMQGSLALMLGIYDADGNTLKFENLQNKKIKGSKDWKQYSVTLPLSLPAQTLHIGPLLIGKGKLWIDDIELLIDGVAVQKADLRADFNPNPPRTPRYGSLAASGHYLNIKDAKLYYEVYGSGEPLLLLHGNSQSIYAFSKQIPELSKHYKVIAVDTRGQGKSTDLSTAPFTYDGFADDMKQLLDSLQIAKVNILGWSDGGNTGLIMGIKYPSYVNKLAITGAVLEPTTNAVSNNIWKTIREARNKIKGSDPASVSRKRLLALLLDEPHIAVDQLKLIEAPTLVMAGDHEMVKEEHTRTIAENIPHSKLVIFKDATHFVPVEKVGEFNNTVLEFFGGSR